jgi:predicted Zn-dependent peptidase
MNAAVLVPAPVRGVRPRRWLSLVVAAACVLTLSARPAFHAVAWTAATPQVEQLSNGLTVVVEPQPDATTAGVSLVVRAGARDDPASEPGLFEVLARAMVGGTADHPSAEDLTAGVHAVGGTASILVDVDLTHFDIHVPAGHIDDALDLLADSMVNPRFGVSDVNDAIGNAELGEYSPIAGSIATALWPNHPAAQAIAALTGDNTDDVTSAFTFTDLLSARNQYYVGNNMALAVAGAVDPDEVFARAEQGFGPLPAGQRSEITPVDPGAPRPGRSTRRSSNNQSAITFAFAMPGYGSPDYPAARLLALALSGPNGRLFQDIRTQHGLAYSTSTMMLTYADIGVLAAGTASVDPANTNAALARFNAVFTDLVQHPPDADALASLRAELRGQDLVSRDSTLTAADSDAVDMLEGIPLDADARFASFGAVTTDDLARVAAQYFSPDRAIVLVRQGTAASGSASPTPTATATPAPVP